ncbi:MAG: hypothetical protein ACREJ5_04385 [Geminicoccaceae bacterium]
MITLTLTPRIERGGYHLDRFDAYLGDDLIVASRQPLSRGHDPAEMMTVRHARHNFDSFEPRPIGELARWTIEESSRSGLQRRTWRPPEERSGAARRAGCQSPASAAV